MRMRLLPFLLLLLAPSAYGQYTVTGHVTLPSGTAPSNVKVCLTLGNFSPNVPRVINTGTLVAVKNFCIQPGADGSFSTTLFGNDSITPVSTNWRVDFLINGQQQSSATYFVNHTPFNLDAEVPLSVSIPAGPNQLVTESFPFTQVSASTTWTIVHNFNDANVFVQVFDTNHKVIYPDGTDTSNPNQAVLTFVTAQAGFAIAMHAGAINIATNQPNAIISNSTSPQTVNNQPITFQGSLTAQGPLNLAGYVFLSGVTAASLNTAIQALPGNGVGGTIFLPCNTDITTSGTSVFIDRPLTLMGCNSRVGPIGSRIVSNDGNIPLVLNNNQAFGVNLRNFGVCAGTGSTSTVGVDLDNNVADIDFDHIYIGACGGTFSVAGVRAGSRTTGSPVLDLTFRNTYSTGSPIGFLILRVNNVNFYKSKAYDNTIAQEQIGDSTHLAISVQHYGCDKEPNTQTTTTASQILNGSSIGFHGCYFENNTSGWVIDVPASATLAENIVIDGGTNFHGNGTATSAIHSNLATATWSIRDVSFNNYPNGVNYITNDASKLITVASLRSDNSSSSLTGGTQGITGVSFIDINQGSTNSGSQFAFPMATTTLTPIADQTALGSATKRWNASLYLGQFYRSGGNNTFPDLFGNGTSALVLAGKTDGSGSVSLGLTSQLILPIVTGTAPLIVTSTTPVANLTSTPATYNAAGTQQVNVHIVEDFGTLSSGSPSTATITLTGSAAFTSNVTYNCSITNKTTQANALKVAYTDGSHFVVTGPNTVADAFSFICVGN